MTDPTFADLFWSKVTIGSPDDCWPWQGAIHHRGYGVVRTRPTTQRAHRVAWTLTFGDPGKYWVLHTCDNRVCCNPFCLFLGTNLTNMQDMVAKGRSVKGRHPIATRLNIEQVEQIRSLYTAGGVTQRVLAEQFDVHADTVRRIVHRETWK